MFNYFNRLCISILGKHFNIDLFTKYLQLVNGCRAVYVTGYEHRIPASFGFKIICQFGRERRFTGSLEPCYKNHGRISFQIDLGFLASHQFNQLIMNNLDHKLPGRYSCKHIFPKGLVLYIVSELFGYFKTDVCVKQGFTDIFQSLRYIDLRYMPVTFQYFKCPVEFVT